MPGARDRFLHFAMGAAAQAVTEARFADGFGELAPDRVGVLIGVGIGGLPLLEAQHERLLEGGPRRVSPFFIPMFIPDMASGMVSMRYGAQGPNYATVSACASSGHSVGLAFRSIRNGEADVMITGGSESTITPLAVAGFANMRAMSTRNDDPKRASRPFDAHRDGFVLGEGAGMFILEELEHARARGAVILGEVAGFGQSAGRLPHDGAGSGWFGGAVSPWSRRWEDAGLEPTEVGYINAHGTSTPANDVSETKAIKDVLGEHAHSIVVGSTKSMTGHTLGAAGAIEGAISALVCRHGIIPPTIKLRGSGSRVRSRIRARWRD